MKFTFSPSDPRLRGLILLFPLFVIFFLCKFVLPSWIPAGDQDWAQEALWGPAGILFAGSFFTLFCWANLKEATARRFFAAVFVFLLVTKFEVLFFPPYGEVMAGPFSEALWLKHHSFDYAGLAREHSFATGGPKVYLFSIYPTFQALLMKFIPSVKAFLILNHALAFAMAAAVVVVFRQVLLKIYNPGVSLLGALCVLFLPLFQSMEEAINMEISCLFFAMFSAYYLIERRVAAASLTAILSSLIKAPGGLAAASVFMVTFFELFDRQNKNRFINFAWGTLAFIFGIGQLVLMRAFVNTGPDQPPAGTINFFVGWLPLVDESRWLVVLYLIGLLGLGYRYFKEQKNKLAVADFLTRNYSAAILYLFATMWFGVYLNVSVMGPRYQLLLVPFLAFCLIFTLTSVITSPRPIRLVLSITIALFCLGSYGLFHFKKVESSTWSYNRLERSLEYRNDLKLHMALAHEIEQNYANSAIGAPFVVAQMLYFPELGYVKKQLDTFVYGIGLTYMPSFQGLKKVDILHTTWIGFYKSDFPVMGPQDHHLKDIRVADKKAALFMGGFSIEKVRILVELYHRGLLK